MKKNYSLLFTGFFLLVLSFGLYFSFPEKNDLSLNTDEININQSSLNADIFDTDNDCTGPDGAIIADGTTGDYYFLSSSPDCANQKEARLCTAGSLSGTATFSSCSAPSSQSCTGPDGAILQDGQSKTYYSASQSDNCGSITQSRTCNNGVLSGDTSYQHAVCADYSSCTGPDGTIVSNGQSKAYYQASESINCQSVLETRNCSNGVLSGSYSFSYCNGQGDSDGDGIADNEDPDDDNDGVLDANDAFPTDRSESLDSDGDGIGNNADTDDDNDGFSDTEEINARSNPFDAYSTPAQDEYGLCEIWKDESAGNINWAAQDYTYEKTTSEVVDGEVVETTETITDPIQTGSFNCTGPGGNYTEGFIQELPGTQSGILPLPSGFPLLNDLSCAITIKTEEGISSSCSITQQLVSINSVNVNGIGNTWHFPISVQGTKTIPLVYGGNTHELYGETSGINGVSKQTQITLITDKKSDEQLEWYSPAGDTGSLRDALTNTLCTSDTPCTGEKVIFTSTQKEGTSSIVLRNVSTKETASFTIHILPSAVESFRLENPSNTKIYEESRVDLSATMNLFNGEIRTSIEDELDWEFSFDGGNTWNTQSDNGTIAGGVFIPNTAGLYLMRAKTENQMAGIGEESLFYKTEEILGENTLTIEVHEKPNGLVTVNGEVAPWHIPVSQSGSNNTSLTYGSNTTYSQQSITTPTPTPTPTASENTDPLAQAATETDTNTTSAPECDIQGCISEYQQKVSTETNVVLMIDKADSEEVEWTSAPSDTGVLKDFLTGAVCTIANPCTGDRVIFYGGTKEGTSAVSLRNITQDQSMTYTLYTLPSATESIRISTLDTVAAFTNKEIELSAMAELFNGNTENIATSEIIWEFSDDGGSTWLRSNEKGIISDGKFIAYTQGFYTFRARVYEKNSLIGNTNLRYKTHEVISSNTLSIQVKQKPLSGLVLNGETKAWHFPVSQKGTKDVIQVYGGNSSYFTHLAPNSPNTTTSTPTPTASTTADASTSASPTPTPTASSTTNQNTDCTVYGCSGLYTENHSTETSIVLDVNNSPEDELEWYAPVSDTGYLADYETGKRCLATDPCIGDKVIFHGGDKEGISSIVLDNKTEETQVTYTVYTLPSAIESVHIDSATTDKGYIGKKIDLLSTLSYFNGIQTNESDELLWEFSYDGGTTWVQSSDDGVIASGSFIPKKEGLVSVRARVQEKRGIVGPENLLYKDHEIISENILSFEVFPALESRLTINGKQSDFIFPVSQMGSKDISLTYGERIIAQNTETTNSTNTTTNTSNDTNTEDTNTDDDDTNTQTEASTENYPTATPTPSTNLADINNPIPNGSREIITVAKQTHFILEIETIAGEEIQWHTSMSDAGYLEDPITKQKCLIESPCTGEKVAFYGGEKQGTTSITLHNNTTQENISYDVHTLPSATERIFVKPFTYDMYYAHEDINLLADVYQYNGITESHSEEISWQFSYDGGDTWEHNGTNGIISAGVFTPYKTGNVAIRAFTKEVMAGYGESQLSTVDHIILSENTTNITIDEPRIIINQAHLYGNNRITRNTNTDVSVGVSSRDVINNMQSLSIMLMSGHIDEDSYTPIINPIYVFKEYHDESPVKEFLANDGDRNYGIIDIPIFIPEYDAKRDMRDGPYTIMLVLHKNDRVVSRYFLPVILGEEYGNCDINDDGFENVIDLILTLKFLNGSLIPNEIEKKKVDMNVNGLLDLSDVLKVFGCVMN